MCCHVHNASTGMIAENPCQPISFRLTQFVFDTKIQVLAKCYHEKSGLMSRARCRAEPPPLKTCVCVISLQQMTRLTLQDFAHASVLLMAICLVADSASWPQAIPKHPTTSVGWRSSHCWTNCPAVRINDQIHIGYVPHPVSELCRRWIGEIVCCSCHYLSSVADHVPIYGDFTNIFDPTKIQQNRGAAQFIQYHFHNSVSSQAHK